MENQVLPSRESKKNAAKRFILSLMHGEGVTSQTRIVEKTSIRPGTVQTLIEELMKEGLVRVSGEGKSKGGRRPTLLEINPNAYWTIGIDLDEERIFAGLVDLKGSIVREVGRTRCRFKSQDDFLDSVKQVIRELLSQIPKTTSAAGGHWHTRFRPTGRRASPCTAPCSDSMRDVPVKQLLEKEFGFPLQIDNDTVVGRPWGRSGSGRERRSGLPVRRPGRDRGTGHCDRSPAVHGGDRECRRARTHGDPARRSAVHLRKPGCVRVLPPAWPCAGRRKTGCARVSSR